MDTNEKKRAVVVIRHGQKGPKDSDIIQDKNPALPFPPNRPSYFDTTIDKPILGHNVGKRLYFCNLSLTGYEEGTSFATTVPFVMKDFQPITRAIILDPSVNGNTYVTAYPLLADLVKSGSLKELHFYSNAEEIKDILIPTDSDGSILVAGDAKVLKQNNVSILSLLKDHYGKDADVPQRGRYIYVYNDDPKTLTKYTQDPDSETVSSVSSLLEEI
ncbi:MAG: hypothetical protein ACI8ZM_004521 [Crocinitomix sp.]|jgi:hypothetical protein